MIQFAFFWEFVSDMLKGSSKSNFDENNIIKHTRVVINREGQGIKVTATTPRLMLRSSEMADAAFFQNKLFSDPEVMKKWNDGTVQLYKDDAARQANTVNYAQSLLQKNCNRWAQGNVWSQMTVLDAKTKELIGSIGVWGNDLAYLYKATAWGNGFASEAACALTKVITPSLILAGHGRGLTEVNATARPDHPASQIVLTRAGLLTDGLVKKIPMQGKELERLTYTISTQKLVSDYLGQKAGKTYSPLYQLMSTNRGEPRARLNVGGYSLRATVDRQQRYGM